jgi:hypothetical protein
MSNKHLRPYQLSFVNQIKRQVANLYIQSIYSQLDEIENSLNYDVSRNGINPSQELLDCQQEERELLALRKQIAYN